MTVIRCCLSCIAFVLFVAVGLSFVGSSPANADSQSLTSLVTLSWTAPGDDGLVGRATRYDLRYSKSPITTANFAQATVVVGVPLPGPAGFTEHYAVGGLNSGSTYYFAIKTVDESGNWSAISNVVIMQAPVTGVGDPAVELSLSAPWPSPANSSTRLAYSLPEAGPVELQVFDITGRLVRTVASGWRGAGRGELVWDLSDVTGRAVQTGMYMMRVRLGGKDWSRRVLVVR